MNEKRALAVTREELHRQVWSQPMRTLASSMGISDVALAKRCKAANVPVPPRGWWARKAAGKPVKVAPLPPLPFAMANYFPAIDRAASHGELAPYAEEQPDDVAPGRPIFRDMAMVSDEIRSAVRPIKVPTALADPHPLVARLLKQDAQRRPSPSISRYFPDSRGPKFATAIQQRRLRILSCVLTELERLGCKASGNTHAGERFSIRIGGHWTYIFFGVEGGPTASYFHNDRRSYKTPDREQLRFDLVEHDDRTPPKRVWREDKTPFEKQVTEIVRDLLIQVEEDARKWALLRHKWACEDRERKIREAKLAAEKAEADRIAREKAAAAARVEALLSGADALELAARIRRYVFAVRAAHGEKGELASTEALERWAVWALAQADAIDPVASGRFATDMGS